MSCKRGVILIGQLGKGRKNTFFEFGSATTARTLPAMSMERLVFLVLCHGKGILLSKPCAKEPLRTLRNDDLFRLPTRSFSRESD